MASVKKITLFGTDYDVMDETARTTAKSAESKANQAMTAVQDATSVSYDSETEALVFTKGGNE